MAQPDSLEKQDVCLETMKHCFQKYSVNYYQKHRPLMPPGEKNHPRLHSCLFCCVLYLAFFSYFAVTQDRRKNRIIFFPSLYLTASSCFVSKEGRKTRLEMGEGNKSFQFTRIFIHFFFFQVLCKTAL